MRSFLVIEETGRYAIGMNLSGDDSASKADCLRH
jgi:hypothetical protein